MSSCEHLAFLEEVRVLQLLEAVAGVVMEGHCF